MDLHINSTSVSPISPLIQFIFVIVFLPPEFSSQNTHLQRLAALMNDSHWLTLLNQFSWHSTGLTSWQWNDATDFRTSSVFSLLSLSLSGRLGCASQAVACSQSNPASSFCGDSGRVVLSERGRNEGSGRVVLYAWAPHAILRADAFPRVTRGRMSKTGAIRRGDRDPVPKSRSVRPV